MGWGRAGKKIVRNTLQCLAYAGGGGDTFTETGNTGRGLGMWKQGEETRIRLCGDPLKECLRI